MNIKRGWIRFPANISQVTIHIDDAQHEARVDDEPDDVLATVIDESYGGVSVFAREMKGLEIGKHVHVTYGSFNMPAEVRYVKPMPNGDYRIGLQWIEPGQHD